MKVRWRAGKQCHEHYSVIDNGKRTSERQDLGRGSLGPV
jgi:hypothetical protein